MNNVRRFYNSKGQEVDAAQATHSAEFVTDDQNKIVLETAHATVRKRWPEIVGAYTPDGSFRAHSVDDVINYTSHWRKDRI